MDDKQIGTASDTVEVVLLDFSKAFDAMSYALFLRKLRDLFGLCSVACVLIGSFLDSELG
jgi:hypothetical protein